MSRTEKAKGKAMLERIMVRVKPDGNSGGDSFKEMYEWFSQREAYDIVYGRFYDDDIDPQNMSMGVVAQDFYAVAQGARGICQ